MCTSLVAHWVAHLPLCLFGRVIDRVHRSSSYPPLD
uniref:Uncharacterized protein n=1 Tax=Anguilla anguilla TaxID=7936 RepID=A0A0E9RFL1_ANGAN